MLTGKAFCLKREILAIETFDELNDRRAIYLPAGATVTVLSGPRPDDRRLVDIHWSDRKFVAFYEDLIGRGEEVAAKVSRSSAG